MESKNMVPLLLPVLLLLHHCRPAAGGVSYTAVKMKEGFTCDWQDSVPLTPEDDTPAACHSACWKEGGAECRVVQSSPCKWFRGVRHLAQCSWRASPTAGTVWYLVTDTPVWFKGGSAASCSEVCVSKGLACTEGVWPATQSDLMGVVLAGYGPVDEWCQRCYAGDCRGRGTLRTEADTAPSIDSTGVCYWKTASSSTNRCGAADPESRFCPCYNLPVLPVPSTPAPSTGTPLRATQPSPMPNRVEVTGTLDTIESTGDGVGKATAISAVVLQVPSVLMTSTRLLVSGGAECRAALPRVLNPLKWNLGDSDGIGCIVGNICLSAGVVGLHALAVVVLSVVRGSFADAKGCLRFPSLSYLVVLYFAQGVVVCSTNVLIHGQDWRVGVGAAGLVYAVLLLPAATLYIIRGGLPHATFYPDSTTSTKLGWIVGKAEWISTGRDRHVERYGAGFKNYTDDCPRFLIPELLLMLSLGGLAGWEPTSSTACGVRYMVMAGCTLAYTAPMLYLLPFAKLRDHGFDLAVQVLAACAHVLSGMAHFREASADSAIVDVAVALILAAQIVNAVRMLLDCGTAGYIFFSHRSQRLRVSMKKDHIEAAPSAESEPLISQLEPPPLPVGEVKENVDLDHGMQSAGLTFPTAFPAPQPPVLAGRGRQVPLLPPSPKRPRASTTLTPPTRHWTLDDLRGSPKGVVQPGTRNLNDSIHAELVAAARRVQDSTEAGRAVPARKSESSSDSSTDSSPSDPRPPRRPRGYTDSSIKFIPSFTSPPDAARSGQLEPPKRRDFRRNRPGDDHAEKLPTVGSFEPEPPRRMGGVDDFLSEGTVGIGFPALQLPSSFRGTPQPPQPPKQPRVQSHYI